MQSQKLPEPAGGASKLALDAFAWFMNVSSSVLIVFVNKVLMDPRQGFGFVFATSLCSLHFFASGAFVRMSEAVGIGQPQSLPLRETLQFSLIAGVSIASLNLSLLTNSIGFYQIAKLMIIPFVCIMEALWLKRKFTWPVILSILVVVVGVAIVTVTDVTINPLGLCIAGVSVVTSGLQQMLCGVVQRKYNCTSNQLLSNTAPVQGALLLFTGPFIDKLVSGKWILDYQFTNEGVVCLGLSCAVAVLVNISQFMCLGRFSAISFQVLGHAKTVLVLLLGWLYLNDSMNDRKLTGMVTAVAGMVLYGFLKGLQERAPAKPEPAKYARIPTADQEAGPQKI